MAVVGAQAAENARDRHGAPSNTPACLVQLVQAHLLRAVSRELCLEVFDGIPFLRMQRAVERRRG